MPLNFRAAARSGLAGTADRSRWHGVGCYAAALLFCTALGACAPRGKITLLPRDMETGNVVQILTATSRETTDLATIQPRARAESLSWADFRISVPPKRAPGTVTFPAAGAPNPETDFLTVSAEPLPDESAFLAALNASLALRPKGRREVTLFVHGFNTNFAEGLYRHAQMAHDFRSPGVSVFYAWPSAASLHSYAFDRESALFARDGLENLVELLARSNAEDIVFSGHSMGAFLVMEAVRQIGIRGSDNTLNKLQAVVLIAPDLDIDLFRTQVKALVPREVPIYAVVSGRDRALRLSALLRGDTDRLGSIKDNGRVADLPGVVVIDLTDVRGSGDPLNHFAVATSPEMIAMVSGLDRVGGTMLRDGEHRTNLFEATLNTVAGVSDVVLRPLVP